MMMVMVIDRYRDMTSPEDYLSICAKDVNN